jgi:hypothetical protein
MAPHPIQASSSIAVGFKLSRPEKMMGTPGLVKT